MLRHQFTALTGLVALGATLFLTVSPAPAAESAAASATAPAGYFPVDSRSEFHALNPILRFLEDPAGKLTVEDVSKPEMQARFRSTPNTHGPVNFGYSRSAFWLRIPLALDADTPSRWQLEIAFAALDRVEVYTRRAGGGVDMPRRRCLRIFADRNRSSNRGSPGARANWSSGDSNSPNGEPR